MNDGLTVTAAGERMGGYEPDSYQEGQIAQAESQGLRHTKIELNPAYARGGQEEIRITGVYIANSFVDGKDQYGLDNIKTVIQTGSLIFTLDKMKRKWFADMLDDTEPGVLCGPGERKDIQKEYTQYTKDGPVRRKYLEKNVLVKKGEPLGLKGYNRDFLATHWSERMFIIHDPEIRQDVENRYLMSIGKKPVAKAPVNEEQKMKEEVERLKDLVKEKDRQIATITHLKGRPAKRRQGREIDDKHEKNDNDVAEGGERLEQNGGQGDSPGTE